MFLRYIFPPLILLVFSAASYCPALTVTPVYPAPGEIIATGEFMIAASVEGEDTLQQRRTSAFVIIDNGPAPGEVRYDEGMVRWTPPPGYRNRASGNHAITVVLKEPDGSEAGRVAWECTVLKPGAGDSLTGSGKAGEDRPALIQDGLVFVDGRQYSLAGAGRFEALTGGAYRVRLGDWTASADVLLSTLEDARTQSRNLYSAGIRYGRWFDLTLGDTRPQWHPAILSGVRIRGVDANGSLYLPSGLNLLNVSFVYGEANRPVKPYRSDADSSVCFGTYGRSVMAGRLSFGSGEMFQLGLSFLKGKDDTASIKRLRDSTGADTSRLYFEGSTPEDNLVFNGDLVVRLWQRRIELFGTYGLSLFTRNIGTGYVSQGNLDTIMGGLVFNPADWQTFLVINPSTTPLSGTAPGILNSSYIDGGLRLRLPLGTAEERFLFKYELKGNNYVTMGNPYMGPARQGFTVSNGLSLLSNRLVVEAEYRRFVNDLDELSASHTLTEQANATVSFFYAPEWPGITLGYAYSGAGNADTAFGFSSGLSSVNVSAHCPYAFGPAAGAGRLFFGWTEVSDGWKTNSYPLDSLRTQGSDTSMVFSSAVWGIGGTARWEGVPVTADLGISGNAGDSRFLRLFDISAGVRWEIIAKTLGARAGLSLGGASSSTDGNSRFFLKVPYGADYTHCRGHRIVFDGYWIFGQRLPDFVNFLRYEWTC